MPRLTDHSARARGIDRPQNRPDIVRIFDAVEDHDQRWRRAAADQIRDPVAIGRLQLRDDALVHAAFCGAIEIAGRHAPNRHVLTLRDL